MKKIRAQKILPGMVAMAAGYTTNTRPGPSVATSWIGIFAACAIYPNTEKITNPAMKLVAEFIIDVKIASLGKPMLWLYSIYNLNYVHLLIYIVVIFIVWCVSQQHTKTWPQREEYLCRCIHPDLTSKNQVRQLNKHTHFYLLLF